MYGVLEELAASIFKAESEDGGTRFLQNVNYVSSRPHGVISQNTGILKSLLWEHPFINLKQIKKRLSR
jgi:hypothetical protein